jgi:UDP-N-acetylglucosamine--N-acetylmuramyl-(pentapeptide) pyrophosphoryl-undecaprenol N-acetylglucosamine transferase
MIPLPSAIDNHQLENAKQIANLNLGLIFEESESFSSLKEKLQIIIGQKKFIIWQNAQDSIDHFQAAERMLSSVLAITK